MILRKRLLRKLQTIMPAIATHDLMPALMGVYFTGTHVVAYNGDIGLSAPLCTEFNGVVPGRRLIDLLRSARTTTVELLPNGASVQLKLGDATATLEVKSAQDFLPLFPMPTPPPNNIIKGVGGKFFTAIERCLDTTAEYSTNDDMLGVTLIPTDGRQAKMFSTNNMAMTYAELDLAGRLRKRVCLHRMFCKELLRLAKRARSTRLAGHATLRCFLPTTCSCTDACSMPRTNSTSRRR
jgi:hypothetical protein